MFIRRNAINFCSFLNQWSSTFEMHTTFGSVLMPSMISRFTLEFLQFHAVFEHLF